jgi:hypothetical protein
MATCPFNHCPNAQVCREAGYGNEEDAGSKCNNAPYAGSRVRTGLFHPSKALLCGRANDA